MKWIRKTINQLYDESYANNKPMSNKLITPYFNIREYLKNFDTVRGKSIRIQRYTLIVSNCMLSFIRLSFEVVKKGRILKKQTVIIIFTHSDGDLTTSWLLALKCPQGYFLTIDLS
jgi:hypothetical protein